MKEFNLSDNVSENVLGKFYREQYVKEFIKKLKEELREMGCNAQKVSEKAISRGYRIALSECLKEIDKLAGEELSK